jgi:cyanophycinase
MRSAPARRSLAWLWSLTRLLCAFLPLASLIVVGGETIEASPRGALVLVGGGTITPEIAARFVALAGGRNRRFVYIPTAASDSELDPAVLEHAFKASFGVKQVTILHTRDRRVADSRRFTATIEQADAVWFGGGRQWRIADAYLGTGTEAALRRLLQRGGVVGGTSAGASILASYLVRGAPEGNWIVSAPGHEDGFGLLPDSAVDQHVDLYHRENDLAELIKSRPDLLGISLDESTALVVLDSEAVVLGRGRVILHDGESHCGLPFAVLGDGDHFIPGAPLIPACPTIAALASSEDKPAGRNLADRPPN